MGTVGRVPKFSTGPEKRWQREGVRAKLEAGAVLEQMRKEALEFDKLHRIAQEIGTRAIAQHLPDIVRSLADDSTSA